MTSVVLDASALLAFLRDEPGAAMVASVLSDCFISAVNLTEVYAKLARYGSPLDAVAYQVNRLQIPVIPFDAQHALLAASVHAETRTLGLSLADCACLALAMTRRVVAVTADRMWSDVPLDIEIVLIR